MEERTRDHASRLCTRIGASMEDHSADLLFTRCMSEVEIVALLNRVEGRAVRNARTRRTGKDANSLRPAAAHSILAPANALMSSPMTAQSDTPERHVSRRYWRIAAVGRRISVYQLRAPEIANASVSLHFGCVVSATCLTVSGAPTHPWCRELPEWYPLADPTAGNGHSARTNVTLHLGMPT